MKDTKLTSNLPSLLFVGALIASAALAGYASALPQKLAFSILSGLLLVGALEAVHQATHDNLFSARWANSWIGTALALVLLLNFVRYRYFHAYHHAYTATSKDPERGLYLDGGGNGVLALLLAPYFFLGFAVTVFRSRYEGSSMRGAARWHDMLLGCFVAGIVALTVWQPLQMAFVYWLPLALFSWFDFLLNQAEHYGSPELAPGEDASHASNDLLLPRPLALLFLYRNFHRVHHLAPQTAWYSSEVQYRQHGNPGMRFGTFFMNYLTHGTRLWGVR